MSAMAFSRSREALDTLADAGRTAALWWRDDDARQVTPALERLLALARASAAPLGLAVIPEGLDPALADRLAAETRVTILLHGHAHRNHALDGEKRAEFGEHRPAGMMADEIVAGRAALGRLFAGRFLPVFVPPWNRIGASARRILPQLGFSILSVYGPAKPTGIDGLAELNTRLDVMNWRDPRGLTADEADARLAALLAERLAGSPEPIGLLTHHLQHDETAWSVTAAMIECLAAHSAITWPSLQRMTAALSSG
ncbi:polysaccharide deacetylase [Jiella sp. MQZ9-1]|uniref:Polysaccharide deacetylase n=1 Tax=Jiella flava TaxID=2816857 RepID=A0A939FZ41_9HYPH|nr:polysaccharide deacetylase [Jiella flava]MBO0664152.1 polysaccharide deacetylase [Jiella flava]MCD2472724.1 polysaccharide deacetylase [Jiella flava]